MNNPILIGQAIPFDPDEETITVFGILTENETQTVVYLNLDRCLEAAKSILSGYRHGEKITISGFQMKPSEVANLHEHEGF